MAEPDTQAGAGQTVYRPVLTRVLAGFYVAVALWWLVAELLGPRPGDALVLGLVLLAIGVGVYVLLWRPAVVVDGHGVRLLNLVRDVDVPWPALEGVETRYALTLLTADASYQSWAGAAAGRPQRSLLLPGSGHGGADAADHRLPDRRWQPDVPTPDRASRDLRADSGAAAFLVEQGWAGWRAVPEASRPAEPEEARVTWNLPVVVALAVTTVAAVLAVVLAV